MLEYTPARIVLTPTYQAKRKGYIRRICPSLSPILHDLDRMVGTGHCDTIHSG